jgi:hypothetical protein
MQLPSLVTQLKMRDTGVTWLTTYSNYIRSFLFFILQIPLQEAVATVQVGRLSGNESESPIQVTIFSNDRRQILMSLNLNESVIQNPKCRFSP